MWVLWTDFQNFFLLIGNLKILELLKLLVVSNIQCNVFKIRYEGSKYIKKKVYLPVDMNKFSDCEIWVSAAVLLKIQAWDINDLSLSKFLPNDHSFFCFRVK